MAELMSAESLMKLTASVGNTYSNMLSGKTQDYIDKSNNLMATYTERSREISRLYEQNLGFGRNLDPTLFAELSGIASPLGESSTMFLQRTLLTGSDIAGISLDMLSNFTDMTLSTELPI